MDKTYNLGEFHVTPTVYKDKSVKRRDGSQDHPICFGPTFIHQSSTIKAYQSFLHDIADNLKETIFSLYACGGLPSLLPINRPDIIEHLKGLSYLSDYRVIKETLGGAF